MNAQKACRSVAAVFGSILLVACLPATVGSKINAHGARHVESIVSPVIADGGAPVPPYPKPPMFKDQTFIADGGAPVPPYPKPPMFKDYAVIS